jgi:isopenicillin N synthase-like dioxygenase
MANARSAGAQCFDHGDEMIPVIDLTDYLAGRHEALKRIANDVQNAFTRMGIFVITGHDVPARLIEQTFVDAKLLHDLPMADKVANPLAISAARTEHP